MYRKLSFMIVVGVMFCCVSQALAGQYTSTSFEAAQGYSLGVLDSVQPTSINADGPGWTTLWYKDGGSSISVVAGGAPGGGSQHMQGTTHTIRREFQEFTEGLCIISMKVRLDGDDPWGGAEARFQLEETNGLDALDFSIFNSATQTLFRTPGNTWVDPNPDIPANTWFDIVFTLDIDNDQAKVEYSTSVGEALNTLGTGWYNMENAVTNIGRITLNGASTAVNWDDIVITPEPATIMLLGLGGLGLIRRKH